jgi:hypothetical protein
MGVWVITYWDFIIGPIYLLLIYLWARSVQRKAQPGYPVYRWFTRGVMVKCFSAILMCLLYEFYYRGGDTLNYYYSAQVLANVFNKDPAMFLRLLLGERSWETFSVFDNSTGWPLYWKDEHGFFVVRLVAPLCMLAFHSYLGTALLLATIFYAGVWRLFLLFNYIFPNMDKQFAISILFIPSVVFWGSGLMKDTITLGATGLFAAHFYSLLIQRKYTLSNAALIGISVYLMIAIKPYILFALIPGSILWLSNERLARMKNKAMRYILTPIMLVVSLGAGYYLLTKIGSVLGAYSLDNVLEKAAVSNMDQKQAYYGGNSFDIGDIDPSVGGVTSKAHLAIFATLFRPMLFEAKNPLMLLSALENTYILLLTVFLIIRLKFFGFFRVIGEKPLLLFSLLFALFFAFSVGVSVSNFGTLVRLKIPCIPFYVSSLFVIRHLYEEKTKKKLGI